MKSAESMSYSVLKFAAAPLWWEFPWLPLQVPRCRRPSTPFGQYKGLFGRPGLEAF